MDRLTVAALCLLARAVVVATIVVGLPLVYVVGRT